MLKFLNKLYDAKHQGRHSQLEVGNEKKSLRDIHSAATEFSVLAGSLFSITLTPTLEIGT